MPRFNAILPQYTPISLDDRLKVPMLIQAEKEKQLEAYNQQLDNLSTLEAMTDESTKDYLDDYKQFLNSTVNAVTNGTVGDLQFFANRARGIFRDKGPRLTEAYNRREADRKALQEAIIKDPSLIHTKLGTMQQYMNNKDAHWAAYSLDKVYKDMVESGALAAKDIVKESVSRKGIPGGYFGWVTETGYSKEAQSQYATLTKAALNGDVSAQQQLESDPSFQQPWEALKTYIQKNNVSTDAGYSQTDVDKFVDKALSSQLLGMQGTKSTDLKVDKNWELNHSGSGNSNGNNDLSNLPYIGNFAPFTFRNESTLKQQGYITHSNKLDFANLLPVSIMTGYQGRLGVTPKYKPMGTSDNIARCFYIKKSDGSYSYLPETFNDTPIGKLKIEIEQLIKDDKANGNLSIKTLKDKIKNEWAKNLIKHINFNYESINSVLEKLIEVENKYDEIYNTLQITGKDKIYATTISDIAKELNTKIDFNTLPDDLKELSQVAQYNVTIKEDSQDDITNIINGKYQSGTETAVPIYNNKTKTIQTEDGEKTIEFDSNESGAITGKVTNVKFFPGRNSILLTTKDSNGKPGKTYLVYGSDFDRMYNYQSIMFNETQKNALKAQQNYAEALKLCEERNVDPKKDKNVLLAAQNYYKAAKQFESIKHYFDNFYMQVLAKTAGTINPVTQEVFKAMSQQ